MCTTYIRHYACCDENGKSHKSYSYSYCSKAKVSSKGNKTTCKKTKTTRASSTKSKCSKCFNN